MFRLREVLADFESTGMAALVNRTESFVVTQVVIGPLGDIVLEMTGGFRIVVFPAGTREECWRFFKRGDLASHIVWPPECEVVQWA